MQFNRPYTPVVVKACVLVVIWPTHSTFVSINKFHRTLLYGPERKTNFVTAFYLLIAIYWRSSKMHENEYEMLAIHFSLAKWHKIQKWVSCETNGKQWLIMRSIFLSVVPQKPAQCRIGSCCWRGRCCYGKPKGIDDKWANAIPFHDFHYYYDYEYHQRRCVACDEWHVICDIRTVAMAR